MHIAMSFSLHTHWGGPLVKFSPWRHYSCSTDAPTIWTELFLLSPSKKLYSLHQAQLINSSWHMYPSIENGQFFTWYQVWSLLDSGASYPFGPFVKVLHHSGWCTASYIALKSCFTSSSSVHKSPWDYPKTNVHFRWYSVNKRSSEPCLANCRAVFSWQTPQTCSHILSAMAFHMAILIWMLISSLHSCGLWRSYNIPWDDISRAWCLQPTLPLLS